MLYLAPNVEKLLQQLKLKLNSTKIQQKYNKIAEITN